MIEQRFLSKLSDKKALILLGARQVGKSTFLQLIKDHLTVPVLQLNGDDADVREILSNTTTTNLKAITANNRTLIIDEAQRIENIGITIKQIVDGINDVKVIATGSSSFDLANKINEPLTGRKWTFQLYPFSFAEMVQQHGLLEEKRLLYHRLIYGYYPEIVTVPDGSEKERLLNLADSYLYKDILIWERIHKPDKLEKLLQALALQLGNEVSFNELAQVTGLDNQTVESYVQILEDAFIVFRLPAFNRNIRNELKKSRKIYFYDNGIRNAVINQFNTIELRSDKGALWENFLVSERHKRNSFLGRRYSAYFWRTHAQQEIDYVEEEGSTIRAWEFKWNKKANKKFSKSFLDAYQPETTQVISPDNLEKFLL